MGYTTVSAVFVHLYCINPQPCPQGRGGGGDELEGRNLESELYVFSQATKNLLDSSEKKKKSYLRCLLIKISWLELKQTRFLRPYAFTNKPLWFARRLLDRKKEEGVAVFQALLSSPSLTSKALV